MEATELQYHNYLLAYLSACSFAACLMSLRSVVFLLEVLLDSGVEGMVGGDYQGRMVAHLAKVL